MDMTTQGAHQDAYRARPQGGSVMNPPPGVLGTQRTARAGLGREKREEGVGSSSPPGPTLARCHSSTGDMVA